MCSLFSSNWILVGRVFVGVLLGKGKTFRNNGVCFLPFIEGKFAIWFWFFERTEHSIAIISLNECNFPFVKMRVFNRSVMLMRVNLKIMEL